jgi:Kae1-associated kinase Bud32
MDEVIAQGAEAILRKNEFLTKERIKKSYRIPELDIKLRKRRTRLEANLLREANRVGVSAPHVLDQTDFMIKMEFIAGILVKEALNKNNCNELAEKIGSAIALLHSYNIIHGDLTTSNMILKSTNKTGEHSESQLYLIDFGLGFSSHKIEDKAVDLYLLREALESTHFDIMEETWTAVLKSYRKGYKDSDKVIKTLSAIEKRGRYRKR